MTQGALRDRLSCGQDIAAAEDLALTFTIVYEDGATREWAGDVCERVAGLLGPEAVRRTWWKLSDFTEPAVLAGAVSMALRADVIVVAINATEALSLPFYVWVQSWLPHRPSKLAALVALVGLPERPRLGSDRAQDYLRAVACEGHLDFLLEERKLPEDTAADSRPIDHANRSSPTAKTAAARRQFPRRVGAPLRHALLKTPAAA